MNGSASAFGFEPFARLIELFHSQNATRVPRRYFVVPEQERSLGLRDLLDQYIAFDGAAGMRGLLLSSPQHGGQFTRRSVLWQVVTPPLALSLLLLVRR